MQTYNNNILVAIYMITYNHEQYISEAINSIMTQCVNFPFTLFIGEDCSSDETGAICLSYKKRFPNQIDLVINERNIGARLNAWNTFHRSFKSGAKYIALCEGDDLWIDPLKLQKQIDFLETNPEYSMCFGKAKVISNERLDKNDLKIYNAPQSDILSFKDIVNQHYIPSSSLVYRNNIIQLPPFFHDVLSGDILLEVLLAEKGLAKYFDEDFINYRLHSGGITKSITHLKFGEKKLYDLFLRLNSYFEFRHNTIIKRKLSAISKSNLIAGSGKLVGLERLKNIFYWYPKYLTNTEFNLKEIFYIISILFFPALIRIYVLIKDRIVSAS